MSRYTVRDLEKDVKRTVKRNKYAIEFEYLTPNALYSGCLNRRDDCESHYLLRDIFPHGFYNPTHVNKLHGAENNRNRKLDCFGYITGHYYNGIYVQNVLFAKTLNGDIYMRWFGHDGDIDIKSYNSCTDDGVLTHHKQYCELKLSNWSVTVAAITDFIWSRSLHYYMFPWDYVKSLYNEEEDNGFDSAVLRNQILTQTCNTINALKYKY